MFRTEHEHLVQAFEEKCLKLQYEDAQLIAEYLCVEYEYLEHARILLARVFLFRSNFSAAIAVLKNCKHPIARYFLAFGMYESGDYWNSINVLASLKSCLFHSNSHLEVRFPYLVTEADISNLLMKARLKLGDQENSDLSSKKGFLDNSPALGYSLAHLFTQEGFTHSKLTENKLDRSSNTRKRKSPFLEPENSCSSTQSMAMVVNSLTKELQLDHENTASVWSLRVLKAYNYYIDGRFEEV